MGALVIVSICSFISCAKKISFLTSAVVPAARGTVKVTRDQNKNYVIELELLNLSEVERLNPSRKVYVVWMVSDKDMTVNLGQVISTARGVAQKLKVNFKTTSAFKPTKIFITAEEDASVQYPYGETVMATDRF